jgi:cysteine synthase A
MDMGIIDEIVRVSNEDAMETGRKLAKLEGILVGISSGAAVFTALKKAGEIGIGKRIVVMAPDTGERYLSTEMFNVE